MSRGDQIAANLVKKIRAKKLEALLRAPPPSGGSEIVAASITDFDEAVVDRIALSLVAGAGTTIVYNDAGATITISSSGGSSPALPWVI